MRNAQFAIVVGRFLNGFDAAHPAIIAKQFRVDFLSTKSPANYLKSVFKAMLNNLKVWVSKDRLPCVRGAVGKAD